MNKLDVNQVGGFPLTTRILDEIQKAFTIFNSLGALSGDKTIISGCVTTGSNVSNGYVFVNGEVFEFRGAGIQSTVKIYEAAESLVFQDGASKSVIKTRYITFGTGVGAMDWADFKRGIETKELQTMFTNINNSLTSITTKLDTIDENAKVQVNTDWDATTGKAVLLNKPDVIDVLYQNTFEITDIAGDNIRTITFSNLGTNSYMVIGCMVSKSSNYDFDNDVIWTVREKTNTSFKITLREVSGTAQLLDFEYILIPIPTP